MRAAERRATDIIVLFFRNGNLRMSTLQSTGKFGVHLMVDGYGASPARLRDRPRLEALLHDLPARTGMYRICEPVVVEVGPNNMKDPGGISGFVMIAESHLSFHTFPARGFVTIDLYTCRDELDSDRILEILRGTFGFTDADVFVQDRGLRYPASDVHPAKDELMAG
jgi:S-adenosylmethionine decarboxylase